MWKTYIWTAFVWWSSAHSEPSHFMCIAIICLYTALWTFQYCWLIDGHSDQCQKRDCEWQHKAARLGATESGSVWQWRHFIFVPVQTLPGRTLVTLQTGKAVSGSSFNQSTTPLLNTGPNPIQFSSAKAAAVQARGKERSFPLPWGGPWDCPHHGLEHMQHWKAGEGWGHRDFHPVWHKWSAGVPWGVGLGGRSFTRWATGEYKPPKGSVMCLVHCQKMGNFSTTSVCRDMKRLKTAALTLTPVIFCKSSTLLFTLLAFLDWWDSVLYHHPSRRFPFSPVAHFRG